MCWKRQKTTVSVIGGCIMDVRISAVMFFLNVFRLFFVVFTRVELDFLKCFHVLFLIRQKIDHLKNGP